MNRTKALRVAAWTVAGVVGFVLLAWLAVPPIVKSQLESRGSALLGRDVRVADVSFAPWALSLTLRGLTVAAAPGSAASAPQFEAARLHFDADLRSLLRLAPVLEAIEIDAPKLRLARTGASQFDIDDILARLKPAQPAPPAAEPMRFALFNLQLRDGELDFDDRPVERKHTVRSLQVALPFLSNLADDIDVKVEPRLAFALDGTAVDLRGQSVPFASHRTTELAIKLADLPLARWWAYVPGPLPARPEGGVLAADLKLQFAQPPGQVPRVGLAGTTSLRDLAVRTTSGEPLIGFKRLAVQLDDVRPLERQMAFGPVRLEGLEVDVRRDARGQLEWTTLAGQGGPPPADKPAEPAAGATKGAPWKVSVGRAELVGARVRWHDATLQPAAEFALEALDVSAERVRWPTEGEVPIQASVRVLSGAQDVAQLKLQGEASDKRAVLALEADAVQLGAAAPYLRSVLRPTLDGRARLSGGLEWAAGEAPRMALSVKSLQLDDLHLADSALAQGVPGGKGTGKAPRALRNALASVASIGVEDTRVDLLARRVSVGAVRVRQPALTLHRDAEGVLDAMQWVVAPAPSAAPAQTVPAAAPPWRAELNDLLVDGGQLDWTDVAARPAAPVALKLRALRVAAQGLAWPPTATPVKLQLAAQMLVPPAEPGAPAAPPGRIEARGQAVLAPLSARGTVALERLPLHALEPYFGAASPVLLRRAELGARGEFDFRQGTQGPTLNARGDVLLADVLVNSRAPGGAVEGGEELLSWQSLTLKPLRVALAPGAKPSVEIDEIQLSDFFARLTITEQGRFNLSDVQPAPAAGAASSPAIAAAVAAPAPAASASADRPLQNLPIDLVVGGTKLVNGRVDFTDRFIRPSYSAALSELNGTIGRVATGTRDMATVDLRGRVAGTGLLEIRGAVNPTAKPLALDISARTTDIELAPFSPYAGKYAGYGIERGKLSLDVAYRIDADGKLDAKNQLTLNQLTFGEATNSPDATKLPVRLLISLLTDSNGVIDLNLPVSGSINDPQFSIFGLVLKVIGNLLTKAVTAPFSLLAGGGTAELSLVEFVPGTTQIAAASSATIDRVAKALADRPSLRMTVVGAADPVSERAAMQAAALETRVQNEAQRDRARAGAAAPAADATPPPLSAEERNSLVKRIYADTKLPDKPRNLIGIAKDIPLAEMESMLKAATVVSTDTARELALQRGLAVRDALIAKGLPSDRLFLGAPKLRASGEDDAAWTPRVQLTLAGA